MTFESQVQSHFAALQVDPHNMNALAELHQLYGAQSMWGEFIGALHEQAQQAARADVQARLLLTASRLAHSKLRDEELAGHLLELAQQAGAQTDVAYEVQLFAYEFHEQWSELEQFFEKTSDQVADPSLKSRLYTQLGDVFFETLEDPDQALSMYDYAVQLDAANHLPLRRQQALYRQKGKVDELVGALYQELEASQSDQRKLDLLIEMGEAYEQVGQHDAAIQCYQSVHEALPEEPRARAGLTRLGQPVAPLQDVPTNGDYGIEPLADGGEDVYDVEQPVSAGFSEEEASGDAPIEDESTLHLIEALPEAVIEEEEEDEEVVEVPTREQTEEFMLDDVAAPPAMPVQREQTEEFVLDDVAAESEPHHVEVQHIGEPAEEIELVEPEPEEEQEILVVPPEDAEEAGELEYEPFEDDFSPVDDYADEPLEEESGDEEASGWRAQYRHELGKVASEDASGRERQIALHNAALLEWLNRGQGEAPGERALEVWEVALTARLGEYLYEHFSFRYRDEAFWSSVYEKTEAHGSSPALRAQIALFNMHDAERAGAIAEEFGLEDITQLLEDRESAVDNWRKYQRNVEQRHPDLDRDEKNLVVFSEMARMAMTLGDEEKLLDALRRLDRISEEPFIKGSLQLIYLDTDKWPAYVDLIKQEAESYPEDMDSTRVILLGEAIRVYTGPMTHDMQAVSIYKRILEIEPENEEAIDALIALYDKNNRTTDQIALLQQKVELATSKRKKVAILSDIANTYLSKRNQAEAIKAYEQVLEIAPHDGEALEFLKEMYEKRRDWDKLIDVFRRELALTPDPDSRLEGYKNAARMATENIRDPDPGIELWNEALKRAPRDLEAIDNLKALYEKKRDYEALATILERRVRLLDDDAEKMKTYQTLGMLLSDRVQDPDRAIKAWQGALRLDPDDLKARKSVERLYVEQKRWEELEMLYASSGAYADLARVLETLVGASESDEDRVELLLRSARYWRDKLDDLTRAERALDRIHQQIDEKHEGAARGLVPIYEATENHEGVKNAYLIILEHQAPGSEERRQVQSNLMRLHEGPLGNVEEAFAWASEIVREHPASAVDAAEFERLAGKIDAWFSVVDMYRALIELDETSPELKTELRMRLGRVLTDEIENMEEALLEYEGILAETPGHTEAMGAMASIYERQGRWDELMTIYQKRLELAESAEERVVILHGTARIAEHQAGDKARALEIYREAYALDERYIPTLRELHRLYREGERFEDVAQMCREQISILDARAIARGEERGELQTVELDALLPAGAASWQRQGVAAPDLGEISSSLGEETSDSLGEESSSEELDAGETPANKPLYLEEEIEQLIVLNSELGEICATRLSGKIGEALVALGRVLLMDPDHRHALALTEPFLSHDAAEVQVAAVDICAPVYELHGEWEKLVQVLGIKARHVDDAERAEHFARMARISLEELGLPEQSFGFYAERLRLLPEDRDTRSQIHLIADAGGSWEEVIALYEEIKETLDNPSDLRRDYSFALAQMYAERVGKPDDAARTYYAILEKDERDEQALDALQDLFMRAEQWSDMLDVYERKIALHRDDAERVRALRLELAGIWEVHLQDYAEAIGVVEKILADDPTDTHALDMLEHLQSRKGDWEDVATTLMRKYELAETQADRDSIKIALGEVQEERLDKPEMAATLYEEVLDASPESEEAIAALFRVMDLDATPEDVSRRVALRLEPWFTDRSRWQEQIATLETQARTASPGEERIELLHRVADQYEHKLDMPTQALGAYSRAFAEDVQHEATVQNMYRIAEQSIAWETLVNVLEETAEQIEDTSAQRELLRRAASIYVDHIGDVDATANALERVIAIVPDDLESINDLEDIYRHMQDWEKLVGVLKSKASIIDDFEEKKSLLHQAGTIFEEVSEQPQEAIEVYKDVLEIDPHDTLSIDRLEVLYTNDSNWPDLLDIYKRKYELAEHAEAQKDLLYVTGAIYQNELQDLPEAIDVYRRILDIDPMELGALEKLDELYEKSEQWVDLMNTIERELELAQVPNEQHQLKWRLGQLHEQHLDEGARAVQIYQEVLQENPAHEPTLDSLANMIQRGDHELDAAEVLRPIYEASEQWEKLIGVQRLLLGSTEGAEERIEILKEIASIYEGCLEDKAEAFTAYAEALTERPDDDAILDQLERLAGELYAWDPYIDLLDQQIEYSQDPVVQSVLQRRIARVYEEQIQDAGAAIDRYSRVIEQDPMDEVALPALDRLYMQEARWESLTDVLSRRIEQSSDPDERLDFRLRQGMLLRDAIGDTQGALNVYQTILEEEPEEPRAIGALEEMFMAGLASEPIAEILEPYYLSRGEHQKLIEMYTQRLQGVSESEERHALLMQIARVYTEELGQDVEALQPLSAALYEQPQDEQIIEELERIARAHEQWPTVAQTYMGVLEHATLEDEAKLAMWLKLAYTIDEEMGLPTDAETAYLNVLALDSGQPAALAALDRIYEAQQSYGELAEILERRAMDAIEEHELVELNTRLATLYRDQLGEPERAIDRFRAVVDVDPGNLNALEALESLFYATQDFDALYQNLNAQAEVTTDPDRQADLLSQQATLAEQALDRREDAIELLRRVIDLQPDNRDAHQKLRNIYLGEARWSDVVDILEREITLTIEPEEQIGLYEQMGVIWSESLEDEVRALDAWQAALQLDPEYLPALVAMHDIYARRSDYHELSNTLERMLDHPSLPDDRKIEYWVEYADILGDMLQRPEDAIQAWRSVMMIDPGNSLALDALERLYLQEGHWEEAVTVLDARLDRIEDQEHSLFVARQIAQLLDEQIGDADRAASYHELVLELDPTDENAYNALNAVYNVQATPEAYGALVNLYITHAEVVADDAEARTRTLRQAASTFEESLGDAASALVVLLSALSLDSLGDDDLVRELERLAGETGLHGEVVQRYQALLQEATEERDQFDLHRYAGQLLAGDLNEPDEAIYHYQSALQIDPENIELLDRLEELYRRVAEWPALAQILHKRVELAIDPIEKIDIWRKLGEVYETQLMDVDNAVASYEQILAIDDTDLLAIESLERIYEAYGKWEMLIDILRQKVSSSFDPEESVNIRFRIATIYEQMLDDSERAKGAYLDLLAADEGHIDSLLALERLYTNSEEWGELLEVYDRQLGVVYESEDRITIFGKIAYIQEEHFQRLEDAIGAYKRILEVDPTNEGAIQNLERLYYNLSQWPDLVDIVEQHVLLAQDSESQTSLLNELARVHRDQLQDPHSGIDAFVRSLDVVPIQPEAMRELALLYEETDNWDAAVQVYERLAENSLDTAAQIELYDHIGGIYDLKLMDEQRSEQAYLSSLALDPAHVNAIDALREIYERRSDWQAIVHIYKKAEAASRELHDKARYLAMVGRVYDERMDDIVSALRYYEQAQELDPDVVEAAGPLIDVYMRERRFARALPLLEKMIAKILSDDLSRTDELHKRFLQMAQANEQLDRLEPSLEAYHRAYEYNSGDRETMLGLGRQLFRHEDYEASFKIYQNIQLQHLSELDGDEASEVFYNAGLIKQQVGDKPRAIDYFEKVIEYNPDHKEALGALLQNYEAEGYWDRFIDLSRRLLDIDADPKIRFAKLSQIGDIYAREVQDPGMAMQTYLEALELEPKSVIVLRKLLDLYTKTRQWIEAIDMLERLIELEPEEGKRAKFAYTIGVIYRDEVHSNSDAIEAFDKALDNDVHMLKAFEGIDRILTDNKDWKELERAYRRMLKRVADFQHEEQMASLYMMLWKNLGEIYRSRLGHVKSAIKAFEMASELNPGDEQLHLILAQLYEHSGDTGGSGVVKEHRALIQHNPFRIESYRALFKAYIQSKEYDKAWCMASALSFLQSATEQEQQFYTQYLGKNLNAAKGTFNLELFSKIYHPDQDPLTTHIMGQLTYVFAEPYSRDLRDVGINKKKDQLDPNDKLLFCKIYTYVGGRMAPVGLTPLPELYLRRDQALGMRNANVLPFAFIVGADMFQGKDDRELAFITAKRLGWMLPSHYLGSCGYPTEWLKAFFMVALHLSDQSLGLDRQIGPNAQDLIQAVYQADNRTPGLLLNLQKGAKQFLAQGKNPNLSQWLTAVDHTTSRLGLLMCGDLHKAASCIKNDATPIGKSSIKDKIRELVLFSISEEYFELRQQLGLAIGA